METNLRAIRKARGATLTKLAEVASVSKSFVSRVEKGSKICNFETMTQMADYLNVSLDEIAMRDNKVYEKVLKGEVEDEK